MLHDTARRAVKADLGLKFALPKSRETALPVGQQEVATTDSER